MEQVPNLLGITVSTNYDDILSVVIHQNQKFFERWYIITYKNDTDTIRLIQDTNYPNIEILYFDFYNHATFNKGGAIQYAQKHIEQSYINKNILILDSDIFLPDNFYKVLSCVNPYPDTIYGIRKRYDYSSYHNFIEDINAYDYPNAQGIFGFFQFYKQAHGKMYTNSQNCAFCDTAFLHYFKHRANLPLDVKHLGKAETNWDGRIARDFLLDV